MDPAIKPPSTVKPDMTPPWDLSPKLPGLTRAEKRDKERDRRVYTPEERRAKVTGDYRTQDPPPTGLKITNDDGTFMPKRAGSFRKGDLKALNLSSWSFSTPSREHTREGSSGAQTERPYPPKYPPGYTQVARLIQPDMKTLGRFDRASRYQKEGQPCQRQLTEREKYGLAMKARKFLLDDDLMQPAPGTNMYNVVWKAQGTGY